MYAQFLKVKLKKDWVKDDLDKFFPDLDADKSGGISFKELEAFLSKNGEKVQGFKQAVESLGEK